MSRVSWSEARRGDSTHVVEIREKVEGFVPGRLE